MGTMQSLNASLAGSRPTTPHSTVSTMPASQIWYTEEPGKDRIYSRQETKLNRPESTSNRLESSISLSRTHLPILDRPEPIEYRPDIENFPRNLAENSDVKTQRPQSIDYSTEKTSRPQSIDYSTEKTSRPQSIDFSIDKTSRPESLEYSIDRDLSIPESITFKVEELYSRPQKTRVSKEEGTPSECTPLSTDEGMDSLETSVWSIWLHKKTYKRP